jgi:PAS domain S-box-containing protein
VELSELKRILQQVMVLPVVALLLLAGVLIWLIHNSNVAVEDIEISDQRIALATLIERLAVDEETGLRGYQATSDPRFLDPYYKAAAPMAQAVADLRSMATATPLHLNAFEQEHKLWKESFAQSLIAIIAAGGQARDIDINITGRARMDAMRRELDSIVNTSEQQRTVRLAAWKAQVRDVITALILLALFIGLSIGLFTRDRLKAVSAAFRRSLDLQHSRAEALFQSEQQLRTTLASIGDGVIACDAAGRIQMMNLVSQELTGWPEPEARDRPLEEVFRIVNETTREPSENPVAKVKRLNRIVGLANHTLLIRKDGTDLAIEDSGAPIRNEAGELTGVVMVFRDVTIERKTRAALLANEKLAVAGRLAATIAHEIHNPLDSVSNLLYLLQQGSSAEESKDFLHTAQAELARVTQISRAMLSLYRESKAPVPVNLRAMLEDLLLLMERRFHDLGVQVVTEFPVEFTVDGFPGELRQVFTNLIANAAEAAGPSGTVTVRVTPSPARLDPAGSKHGPGALIEVIDNGPGIAPEVREHLFQPFFTTKGERGTGLGLWVSQGIIRKHAGALTLTSHTGAANHGTTATVFLATKPIIDPGGD